MTISEEGVREVEGHKALPELPEHTCVKTDAHLEEAGYLAEDLH